MMRKPFQFKLRSIFLATTVLALLLGLAIKWPGAASLALVVFVLLIAKPILHELIGRR